jgi:hypothetical protein
VGDSFTQGMAVQPGEEIAGQIRNLTNSTVINLGHAGNGPLKELATLKEYAKSLHPSKVLWVYFENDFSDLNNEKENPILMRYLEDNFSQSLMNRQEDIDRRLKNLVSEGKWQRPKIYKTRWLRLYELRAWLSEFPNRMGFNGDGKVNLNPLFAKIISKAKERIEAWGGKLYFVYLPGFSHYTGKVNDELNRKKQDVIYLVKALNIPVIDIHQEVFSDHPDPLTLFPLRINGHYNPEGYSEVAKAIVLSTINSRGS